MSEYKIDYYLKSIDRRWKKEVYLATQKVIVLSPYLTPNTADIILNNLDIANNSEIYTVFSVKNFVSGGSSIKTLKLLHERGFNLYHLPRLHAKMLIVPGKFASIGSQNFTKNGVRNKEASIVVCDPTEVDKIHNLVKKWLINKQKISSQMIKSVDNSLLALRRKICPIWRESNNLEVKIWQDEARRLEKEKVEIEHPIEIKKETKVSKQKEVESLLQKDRQWQQLIDEARNRVIKISEYEKIERSIAENFIANSVYWYDHKCGRPVKAPGHSNNIYGNENNWKIDFGANTFLISKAILQCQKELMSFLDLSAYGYYSSLIDLRILLESRLRSAVANYNGNEYESPYPLIQDKHRNKFMKFGSQAIKLDDLINEIFKLAKLGSLNLYIKQQHSYLTSCKKQSIYCL